MTATDNQIASIEIDNLNLIISCKQKEKFKKSIEMIVFDHGSTYDQCLYFNFGFLTKEFCNKYCTYFLFNPFYFRFLTEFLKLRNLIGNQILMDDLTRKVCLLSNQKLEKQFENSDEFIVFDFYLTGPFSLKQKLNIYWMKFCNLFNVL